jgi:serine/threonine protein kinase
MIILISIITSNYIEIEIDSENKSYSFEILILFWSQNGFMSRLVKIQGEKCWIFLLAFDKQTGTFFSESIPPCNRKSGAMPTRQIVNRHTGAKERIMRTGSWKTSKLVKAFTHTTYTLWKNIERDKKNNNFTRVYHWLTKLSDRHPDNLSHQDRIDKEQNQQGILIIQQIQQDIQPRTGNKHNKKFIKKIYADASTAISYLGVDHPKNVEIMTQLASFLPFFLLKRLEHFHDLAAYANEMQGKTLDFDRYRVQQVLSAKDTGITFKCMDDTHDRDCIVKLLPGMASRQGSLENTLTRATRRVSSAPEIYDTFEYGADHFIVMAYIAGETLKDLLDTADDKRFQDPLYQAETACRICKAIVELHQHQICHLDIKPGNIMIAPDQHGNETVWIIDFGIAALQDKKQLEQYRGTPGYSAPELPDYSERSDIYSLGITIWEMTGNTFGVQTGPIIDRRLELTPLEQIAVKAAAKNPLDRYPTADAMHQALLACLEQTRKNDHQSRRHVFENDPVKTSLVNISARTITYLNMPFQLQQFMIDPYPVTTEAFSLFADQGFYTPEKHNIHPTLAKRIWTEPGIQWLKTARKHFMHQQQKDEVWHKPAEHLCLYECRAFCNWRSIMAVNPDLMEETDTRTLVQVLDSILLYGEDGGLVSRNISGFRLPTELELCTWFQEPSARNTYVDGFEYTTSSYLHASELSPFSHAASHPIPIMVSKSQGLIINRQNRRIPVAHPAEIPDFQPKFRCTLHLHDPQK